MPLMAFAEEGFPVVISLAAFTEEGVLFVLALVVVISVFDPFVITFMAVVIVSDSFVRRCRPQDWSWFRCWWLSRTAERSGCSRGFWRRTESDP
jgi:hypothetical protein